MADEAGPTTHSLTERLRHGPFAFDFFQALRRLECEHSELPRIGRAFRPSEEPIRFGQEPSLAFAPSTLSEFIAGTAGRPGRLLVNFFGLFGPHGPMPIHITQYARDRLRNAHDPTLCRFFDLFHHRMTALFYRAWAEGQMTVAFDRPDEDRYAVYIGSLFGLGMDSLWRRDAVTDVAKLHYSGRLVAQSRHPEGLGAIIADYFGVEARIIEFVGRWLDLPADCRLKLGDSPETGSLGLTTIVGSRIWDCQQKFRIVLGPMRLADYQRLLPGGASLERLVEVCMKAAGGDFVPFDDLVEELVK